MNWRGEKRENVIYKRDYPFKFQLWKEPLVFWKYEASRN